MSPVHGLVALAGQTGLLHESGAEVGDLKDDPRLRITGAP
jgi:hypothetical protein